MRLSEHDRRAICEATAEVAGAGARVLLFGSRVRDDIKGGDIDLLVELPRPAENRLALAVRIGTRIERRIGERRIDVIVADPSTPDSTVLQAARRDGIEL